MYAIPPLAAETILTIGNFPVTNTYINSSLAVIFFVIIGLLVRKRIAEIPRGLQNFLESVLEFLFRYFDQVTGSRQISIRFLPLVGSLFFFILVSNWMGILPGIGSIGIREQVHEQTEFIPLFRPATTDLNLTIAMAVAAVAFSHIAGIFAIGFFRYANRYIKLGDLWHAVRSQKGMNIFTAVIEFLVGLIEIVSEVAKVASLSLRLFGNIFAGEVLLTIIGGLVAFFVPLPFLLLELLVGIIQATVFAMLALVYLTISTREVKAAHH